MKWVFERLYESGRILLLITAAQDLGLLEWISQHFVLAFLIFSALEYFALRPDDADGKTKEE